MKASNDELQDLMDFVDKDHVMPHRFSQIVIDLAQAELDRRQQPASVQAAAWVCCGEYATCLRACTPRGKWLQAQESAIPGGGGTVSARETLGNCGCMGSNATTTGGSGGGMLSPTDRAVPYRCSFINYGRVYPFWV